MGCAIIVWFSISIATRWPVAIISGVTLGQYSPFSDQAYGAMAPARITRCVTSGARDVRAVTASRRRSSERSTGGAIFGGSAGGGDKGGPGGASQDPVPSRFPSAFTKIGDAPFPRRFI